MPEVGTPGAMVPVDSLTRVVREIEDIKREIREIRPLLVSVGTIQSPNFDGSAALGNPGTQGFALDGPTGNAALGSLFLRPGSITNDSLLSPLQFTVVDQRNSGTFVAGGSDFLVQTVTVPAGFTRMYALLNGVVNIQLPTSATNLICFIKSSPGAIQSDASTNTVGAGNFGNTTSTLATSATGLTGGGTFTVALRASVSVAPPAGSCFAALSGLVLWAR